MPLHKTIRRTRGTAEIETMLVIPILLFLLTMVACLVKLGTSRLSNIFSGNEMAYRDATAANNPQYAPSADLEPLTGIGDVKPGLNNRMHVATADTNVSMSLLSSTTPITVNLKSQAAYPSPPWAYSTYPASADAPATEEWFTTYADEARGQIKAPLELSDSWAP